MSLRSELNLILTCSKAQIDPSLPSHAGFHPESRGEAAHCLADLLPTEDKIFPNLVRQQKETFHRFLKM